MLTLVALGIMYATFFFGMGFIIGHFDGFKSGTEFGTWHTQVRQSVLKWLGRKEEFPEGRLQ